MKLHAYCIAIIFTLIACQKESAEMLSPANEFAVALSSSGIFPDCAGYVLEVRKEVEPGECEFSDCAVEIKNYRAVLQQSANETCQSKIGDFTCCMNGWKTCVLIIVEPDKWNCPGRMATDDYIKAEH